MLRHIVHLERTVKARQKAWSTCRRPAVQKTGPVILILSATIAEVELAAVATLVATQTAFAGSANCYKQRRFQKIVKQVSTSNEHTNGSKG